MNSGPYVRGAAVPEGIGIITGFDRWSGRPRQRRALRPALTYFASASRATVDTDTPRCSAIDVTSSANSAGTRNDTRGEWVEPPDSEGRPQRTLVGSTGASGSRTSASASSTYSWVMSCFAVPDVLGVEVDVRTDRVALAHRYSFASS